ncbi:MAG TPA: hypothetical protein VFI49_07805 [Rudaea sp.]|nr:hypothetical protein [Rudaea sp.]
MKAHSGWAALVVIGDGDGEVCVVDRRRVGLVEEANRSWAGAPFHAAEGMTPAPARKLVERAVAEARLCATRKMRLEIERAAEAGHEIVACAVLTPAPMPDWSIEQIRAVHFRMHKAEGVMFPDALARAAETCGLRLLAVAEKDLAAQVEEVLAMPAGAAMKKVTLLGKSVGPPWGADQKIATLAAMIALRTCGG